MNLAHWIHRPDQILARGRYWVWEKMHPGRPWLSPDAVGFLERHLTEDAVGFEFGSGRSTAWFAAKIRHLVSVEHDAVWYEKVRSGLATRGLAGVDYRLVPLDHPPSEGEREEYDRTPRYVAAIDGCADGSLSFVLVDGHYRTHCIRRSVPKVRPGGILVVDDVDLWPSRERIPIPRTWTVASLSSNGIKRTCIWERPR